MDGIRSKAPSKHVPFNLMSVASPMQPAEKTSRIKPVHVYGLLALNPGPIDKSNSKEALPQPVRQKMVATFLSNVDDAPGDTGMYSMPSPCSSAFYTPSVADSVEFTETNPEALHGLGLGIDAIEQKAPAIDKMNDTESESEIEEISAGAASSVQLKQKAPGDSGMPDAPDEISTGGNFALFMAQSAPVQHPFMLELDNLFKNKSLTTKITDDGKTIVTLFQFANIIHGHPMNDRTGHGIVKSHLDNPKHKSALEKYGIYEITTQRKALVPALTLMGLKEFLSKMNCDVADRYRAYEHYLSTLVEASDPISRKLINNFMEANAASSSAYVEEARDFVAQERASGGPSIAAPPEQVPIAEGAADVGFKRKADEDNQIFFWQGLPLTTEMGYKQYELEQDARRKNEASSTKMIKGAEAAGMKAKGLAEAAGIKEIKKAEAFVMRTDANANAIKIEAEAKKTEAEAKKTEAEAMLLQFELEQKKNAAGIGTDVNKIKSKVDVVPLAIYQQSKTRKPLTQEQRDNANRKKREKTALAKGAKDKMPTQPKAAA